MSRSFIATGWPTHITGQHNGGRIENLPVWEYGSTHIPLEVLIPESKQVEFAEAGFTVLSCRPNDDAAYIGFAPVAHRPEMYDDPDTTSEAHLHATLACQVFASRVAHHMLVFQREMIPGLAKERIQSELTTRLESLLKTGGYSLSQEAVVIDLADSPSRPGAVEVTVRLIPPEQILGRETRLGMQFEVRY